MKLLFSNEWLRSKIASDRDIDIEAGGSVSSDIHQKNIAIIGERNAVKLRVTLGLLVRQLRLREKKSIADLALLLDVSEDELRSIEHDPHFTARPRVLYQLSNYFNVPLANLSQIAGATHVVSRSLYNESVRYAAYSDDVLTLSAEEAQALDGFIALLNERCKD